MQDRKENEPVGYTYKAENLCDLCVAAKMKRSGLPIVMRRTMTVWEELQVFAAICHVDVEDESSYDSGDFPKPIWVWTDGVRRIHCDLCREPLIEDTMTALRRGRWIP